MSTNSNTKAVSFTVPAIPIAQPRPRVVTMGGKARAISAKRDHPINEFKASVRMAAAEAYDGPPLDGPLSLSVAFILPRPQSKIWKRKPMPREHHTKKPDFDNLLKGVGDALNGILWRDDSQLCRGGWRKYVASGDESPRVIVEVWQLDPAAT